MSTERVEVEGQTVVGNSANDGFLRQLSGANGLLRSNFSATTDPATTNDNTQGYAVGSQWHNTTNDRCWICIDATTNAAIWHRINSLFGQNFEDFSSLTDSTTTSTTNQTKLSATTAVLPAGRYLLLAEARIKTGTNSREFGITVQVDGVTQHAECVMSQSRVTNTPYIQYTEVFMLNFVSSTTHSLALLYRAVATSSTITINNARFLIWRVS